MLIGSRLGGVLLAAFLVTAAASGQTQPQQPNPPAQQGAPATQSGNGRIYLDVVVKKSGESVTGLSQQDFTLLENKTPQAITSFAEVNGREASIQVVIVIDAVNTTYQNVIFQREQLDKYLRGEGGSLSYPTVVALLTDDGLHAIQNSFTNDGNALSTALDQDEVGFRAIRRSSGYYGAEERFQICLAALRRLIASVWKHQGRKIIIWISPGWPLLSGPNTQLDEKQEQQVFTNIVSLSTELMRGGITLYSIDPLGAAAAPEADWAYGDFVKGVRKLNQVVIGDLALPVLVIQSGGYPFGSTNGVADRLRQCLTDAVPYYEISFDPPAAKTKDEYHELEVKVAGHDVTARTRQGYYAQP